jgi:hypothetical protein
VDNIYTVKREGGGRRGGGDGKEVKGGEHRRGRGRERSGKEVWCMGSSEGGSQIRGRSCRRGKGVSKWKRGGAKLRMGRTCMVEQGSQRRGRS